MKHSQLHTGYLKCKRNQLMPDLLQPQRIAAQNHFLIQYPEFLKQFKKSFCHSRCKKFWAVLNSFPIVTK